MKDAATILRELVELERIKKAIPGAMDASFIGGARHTTRSNALRDEYHRRKPAAWAAAFAWADQKDAPPASQPVVAWALGDPRYCHSSNILAAHEFTPDPERVDEWTPLYTFGQAAPAPALDGWQPIETAPKAVNVLLAAAGTFVPLYCGRKRYGNFGEPQQDVFVWRCDSSGRFANPTHWMPLPPPPLAARLAAQEQTPAAILITSAMVSALRDKSDEPMMMCKRALVQAGGDMAAAEKLLRARAVR